MAELTNDLLDRLAENKKLYEHPGFGQYFESFASFIALHGFWVLLGVSFISTMIFLQMDTHWWVNEVLFGKLY